MQTNAESVFFFSGWVNNQKEYILHLKTACGKVWAIRVGDHMSMLNQRERERLAVIRGEHD